MHDMYYIEKFMISLGPPDEYAYATCDLVQRCLYVNKHFSAVVGRIEFRYEWSTRFSNMIIKQRT